jgi:glyoxylase-like metal-dependent hydrolase (beta-lactamase superfamily II)
MASFSISEGASGVWQVRLPWVVAYILSDGNSWSLVDSGIRWDRGRLLKAIASLGLRTADCHSVLLTHGHCDHAGNAAFFADRCNAPLHAHADERIFIETQRTYIPRGRRALSAQGLMFAAAEVVWPVRRRKVDIALHEGDAVDTPAGTWRVLHTPGHTPGHISFYRESDRVLLSGDAIINVIPFKRVEGLTLPQAIFSADTALARQSAKRLAELAPQTLLPGHGRPICENVAARLRDLVAEG